MYFENYDLTSVVTPINVLRLRNMLLDSGYDRKKTTFLIDGFTRGFDFGYAGPVNRRDSSANLPFRGVGSPLELWNKVMKEVKLKQYAGPFTRIPFKYYMQSPIGLVPKSNDQTRLIFHLSYDFNGAGSFNHHTPDELCTVKYRDLDHAVKNCLRIVKSQPGVLIWLGITDLQSAFRVIPGKRQNWRFLMMKAKHPITGTTYYFADKCMPFGAGISCSLYTEFSNALAHILSYYTGSSFKVTNYLDDFLFMESSEDRCNFMVRSFIEICQYLGVPIAPEKIVMAAPNVKFLGVIMNGAAKILQIPEDKKNKARNLLNGMIARRTATVKDIQEMTGLLNFLAKVIVPGRLFTRRMYKRIATKTRNLQQHHHVTIGEEFKSDARIWLQFLSECDEKPMMLCRPFIDMNLTLDATEIDLYTDSSANLLLGFGGIFKAFLVLR